MRAERSATSERPSTGPAASRSQDAAGASAPAAANTRGFGRLALRLSFLTLLAQACGFASSIVIARVLGASHSTDAYFLGLSVPLLVYGAFLAAVRQGGIPILTSEAAAGEAAFVDASSELVSATLVVSIVVALVAAAIAIILLPLTIGNASLIGAARLDILELTPLAVFGAMIGAMATVLAVRNRFAGAALVLALDPILRIVLLLAAGSALGASALVIANLAGNCLAVFVMWSLVRREGIPLTLRSPWRSQFVRRMLAVSGPLLISQAVLQMNPVIDRTMAGALGAGSITALELGLRLFGVPMLLIGATLIGPLIATWAARKAADGWPALRDSLNRAVDAFALIVPPLLVIGVVLRHQIVDVLYQGGAYSSHAAGLTAAVFAMLLVGLPAQLLTIAFSALFIVEQQTRFCLKAGLVNVVLNVALNFALRPVFGVGGIALSTSVTLTIVLAIYIRSARRRWRGITIPFSGAAGVRAAVAVGLMAGVAYAMRSIVHSSDSRTQLLAEMVVIGLAVLAVYAMVLLTVHERRGAVVAWMRQTTMRGVAGQPPDPAEGG